MKASDISYIYSRHNEFWSNKNLEMRAYSNAYRKKMFSESQASQLTTGDNDVIVETADGYGIIESYVSSLFPKAPAVVISDDATGEGDPKQAQAIVNRFLFDKFALIEQGLRYSLIFPYSGWKLGICNRKRIIDSVEVQPILPWDLITDQNATRWDQQRFVGHRYFLPLSEAKEKFGNKEYVGSNNYDYLETGNKTMTGKSGKSTDSYKLSTSNTKKIADSSTLLTYIEIVEMYDFQNDVLTFYSPHLKSADGVIETISPIPFRDPNGEAIAPIIPMYLGNDPQTPLQGSSTMGRIYSQLYEINAQRTALARFVRRDTRLYLARKGVLDEESKAAISQNIDNSIVEVDCPPDQAVSTLVQPFLNQAISPEVFRYNTIVKDDLNNSGILAPFARGGVTQGASATEISALTLYASSEVGRLSRFRDEAIEQMAEMYLMFIKILLDTQPVDAEKEIIVIDGQKFVLTPEAFDASFRIVSLDQGSTPLGAAAKRQRLLELTPMLLQLGIPKETMAEQLIREFELPTTLLDAVREAASAGANMPAPAGVPGPAEAATEGESAFVPVGGGGLAQNIREEGGLV